MRRYRKSKMKHFFRILIVCSLLAGMLSPTFAAGDSSSAASETEQTVSVSTAAEPGSSEAHEAQDGSEPVSENPETSSAMQLPANASSDSSDLSLPQSSDAVDSITKTESEPPVYSEETPGAFEWKFENQKWYCYSQGAKLKGCGWVEMADGRLYYLLETDECAAGLYEVDGKWYYFNNAMQKNWQQIEGKWYYFDEETGEQVHGPGWVDMSDGRRYYLLETDECAVGWYRVDGTWYYFGNSVQKQYGWQLIEGKWYYFDGETGEQVHGPRWVDTSDGRRYYLLETDECATGLYEVDGKLYYFDNSAQKGWHKIDGEFYYFSQEDGARVLMYGWQQIEGKWYYFDEETGEQVHGPRWVDMSDGRKYYLLETDECAVGWYRVDRCV